MNGFSGAWLSSQPLFSQNPAFSRGLTLHSADAQTGFRFPDISTLGLQRRWHDAAVSFFHFRDKDGVEVDIVMERGARTVAGVEIKASGTVTKADFRGLSKLAHAAGERFAHGVALYDGEITTRFGDRLYAVPIRRLWETP